MCRNINVRRPIQQNNNTPPFHRKCEKKIQYLLILNCLLKNYSNLICKQRKIAILIWEEFDSIFKLYAPKMLFKFSRRVTIKKHRNLSRKSRRDLSWDTRDLISIHNTDKGYRSVAPHHDLVPNKYCVTFSRAKL